MGLVEFWGSWGCSSASQNPVTEEPPISALVLSPSEHLLPRCFHVGLAEPRTGLSVLWHPLLVLLGPTHICPVNEGASE